MRWILRRNPSGKCVIYKGKLLAGVRTHGFINLISLLRTPVLAFGVRTLLVVLCSDSVVPAEAELGSG